MRQIEKKNAGVDDVIFVVRQVIEKGQLSVSIVNVTYANLITR